MRQFNSEIILTKHQNITDNKLSLKIYTKQNEKHYNINAKILHIYI